MRKRKSQSTPKPSRSEFIVDQPPNLIAVNDCGMVQSGEPVEGQFALPHGVTAARNHDVVFLGERFHDEIRRKITGVGEIADSEIKRSIAKFRFGYGEKPIEPARLHPQVSRQHGTGKHGDQTQLHIVAEPYPEALTTHRGIKRVRRFEGLPKLGKSRPYGIGESLRTLSRQHSLSRADKQ